MRFTFEELERPNEVCAQCGAIRYFQRSRDKHLPREYCDCGGALRSAHEGRNFAHEERASGDMIRHGRTYREDTLLPFGSFRRQWTPGGRQCRSSK